MDADKILQALSPFYGMWKTSGRLLQLKAGAEDLYGSAVGDAARRRQAVMRSSGAAAAGFVLFLFLAVFGTLVPAAQAFACLGPTNLYLPGWAWGILILAFWPLGLVWLVFKGGCPASAQASGEILATAAIGLGASNQGRIGLPAMPGLFGNGDTTATAVLLSPGDTMDGSPLFS
jgi:hypothetical protein